MNVYYKTFAITSKRWAWPRELFESGEKLRRLQSISSSVVIITNEVEGKTIKQGYKTR